MKGRVVFAVVTITVLSAAFAATSFGFTRAALVRSGATEIDLHDKSQKLKLQAKEPIHVDIRQVTMTAGEVIGWHGHAGPSLLVVKTGSLTVTQADAGGCSVETYEQGAAFVHGENPHSFRAGSSGADFYIVYLLPQDALPSPIAAEQPQSCS